jgi:PIN domain nuclease of toxin-antitoxin system
MRFLLDTHTIIWYLTGNAQLSAIARSVIDSPENLCFVSAASLWEIAIKISIGKIKFDFPFEDFLQLLYVNELKWHPISFEHQCTFIKLPLHHRDPFDRMLIAQAIQEDFTLISCDAEFPPYLVKLLW